jgi:predicted DNA-binding antitoxin AbrB/MazE fold protein
VHEGIQHFSHVDDSIVIIVIEDNATFDHRDKKPNYIGHLKILTGLALSKIMRVRHDKRMLKLLEAVELQEGKESQAFIFPREFFEIVRKIGVQAGERIHRASSIRGR